jgi:glucuronoarabinoxylan endo-1,4-beta-xylanase
MKEQRNSSLLSFCKAGLSTLVLALTILGCETQEVAPLISNSDDNGVLSETSAAATAANIATINWSATRQTIQGFGASDAWYGDEIMAHPDREELLDLLFTDQGINLSILRQRISPYPHTGVNTYNWSHFQFTSSGELAQEAKSRGVNKIWASCWSPAAWMKDNDKLESGGFLLPQYYDDYANYLLAWSNQMKSAYNIDYYGISPQNEPGPKGWESCDWDPNDYKDFIKNNVGPTFPTSLRIFAPEGTNASETYEYYDVISADAAANNYVDILSTHTYSSAPPDLVSRYGKTSWMTEKYINSNTFNADGLGWAKEIHDGLVNKKFSAYHSWWLVAFDNKSVEGLIFANSSSYTMNPSFYTFGNFSKFVRPGWKRIDATSTPTAKVYVSAYKDASTNKFAVVVINDNDASKDITLSFDGFTSTTLTPHRTSSSQNLAQLPNVSAGSSVALSLPARSVTTYTGIGTLGGGGGADNDRIASLSAPNSVSIGSTASVAVNYEAKQNRDIILMFQKDTGPFTTYKYIRRSVSGGAGTVSIDVPITSDIPTGLDAYQWQVFITPTGQNWGQRFSSRSQRNVDVTN